MFIYRMFIGNRTSGIFKYFYNNYLNADLLGINVGVRLRKEHKLLLGKVISLIDHRRRLSVAIINKKRGYACATRLDFVRKTRL
jgi:hypothetical protein